MGIALIASLIYCFNGWLSLKNDELNLQDQEFQLKTKEFEFNIVLDQKRLNKYSIVDVHDGMTYLVNETTGDTWRWFRNPTEGGKPGEYDSEGWTHVNFDIEGYLVNSPEEALNANLGYIKTLNLLKVDEAKNQNQQSISNGNAK
jgi:hypothetical protein